MRKVLLVHNIITPTRTALFNKLYDYFLTKWYDFEIVFTSVSESNRKWNVNSEIEKYKFKYTILEGKQIKTWKKDKFYFHFNKNFTELLSEKNPEIIIYVWWTSFSAIQTKLWCKRNKKKFYLWSWSTAYERSRRRTLTIPYVKRMVKWCDGYFSYWTRATEYLVSLWAEKKKIYPLYNTVDIDYFLSEAEKLKDQKDELKKKFWIKTKNVILFVWQLIERKWIFETLEWFKIFREKDKDWSLMFVWWWQEKEKMEQIIKEKHIKNIKFLWFFQKNQISELYTIADVFILPSREEVRWLVINEAMCFWLPIITAYQVWACADLVKEGENGYIMKENTWKEFEKWMNILLENNLIIKNSSKEIIKNFRVDDIVKNIDNLLNLNSF